MAQFLLPISRSVYNALQMKLTENVVNPLPELKGANFQISYSLSKFVNPLAFQGNLPAANPATGNDQDFVLQAADNTNPLRYMGPSLLDRVTPAMSAYRDEIFGPVLSVVRVESFDAALALVNASPYGNGAAIFTDDGRAARRFQREVETLAQLSHPNIVMASLKATLGAVMRLMRRESRAL